MIVKIVQYYKQGILLTKFMGQMVKICDEWSNCLPAVCIIEIAIQIIKPVIGNIIVVLVTNKMENGEQKTGFSLRKFT